MFAVLYSIALAATASSCSIAQHAVADAQTSWQAFKNGDFVNHAAQAEAQFRAAKRDLAAADKAAASCRSDRTAIARRRLHFEFDLVDARRNRRSRGRIVVPVPSSRDDGAQRPRGSERRNLRNADNRIVGQRAARSSGCERSTPRCVRTRTRQLRDRRRRISFHVHFSAALSRMGLAPRPQVA